MAEVGIGTAIVAYIEPHEGQAEAFNRWYERDHFYAATTAGPGCIRGARWVATRACKELRPPGGTWFGDPARGSYLTTVWLLDDTQGEWDAWVGRQMEHLRAEGDRMFAGRDHVQTGAYRFVCEVASANDGGRRRQRARPRVRGVDRDRGRGRAGGAAADRERREREHPVSRWSRRTSA